MGIKTGRNQTIEPKCIDIINGPVIPSAIADAPWYKNDGSTTSFNDSVNSNAAFTAILR